MKEIFIDELKSLELEILQTVHDFCIKNNINYSICGGTLIGALRHKGFIPWDDDIDIIMTRSDYEKFKTLFNEQKDSPLKFIDCFNNRQFFQPFGKVVNTKTKLIETYARPIDDMGVYIDVFPVDGIPAGDKNREKFWRKITKIKNLNTVIYEKSIDGENPIKHFIRILLFYMFRPFPANIIAKKISRFAQKVDFNASDTVASSIFGYGRDEETVKSAYNSYVDVEFEGRKFKAMSGYETFLRNIYGDYMQLPPEEKRVLKHDFKAYWR